MGDGAIWVCCKQKAPPKGEDLFRVHSLLFSVALGGWLDGHPMKIPRPPPGPIWWLPYIAWTILVHKNRCFLHPFSVTTHSSWWYTPGLDSVFWRIKFISVTYSTCCSYFSLTFFSLYLTCERDTITVLQTLINWWCWDKKVSTYSKQINAHLCKQWIFALDSHWISSCIGFK